MLQYCFSGITRAATEREDDDVPALRSRTEWETAAAHLRLTPPSVCRGCGGGGGVRARLWRPATAKTRAAPRRALPAAFPGRRAAEKSRPKKETRGRAVSCGGPATGRAIWSTGSRRPVRPGPRPRQRSALRSERRRRNRSVPDYGQEDDDNSNKPTVVLSERMCSIIITIRIICKWHRRYYYVYHNNITIHLSMWLSDSDITVSGVCFDSPVSCILSDVISRVNILYIFLIFSLLA